MCFINVNSRCRFTDEEENKFRRSIWRKEEDSRRKLKQENISNFESKGGGDELGIRAMKSQLLELFFHLVKNLSPPKAIKNLKKITIFTKILGRMSNIKTERKVKNFENFQIPPPKMMKNFEKPYFSSRECQK